MFYLKALEGNHNFALCYTSRNSYTSFLLSKQMKPDVINIFRCIISYICTAHPFCALIMTSFSAPSCTRMLKTWQICLDIELRQLKNGYSEPMSMGTPTFFAEVSRFSRCMINLVKVGKVCIRANVAHQAGAYPGFRSMKRLGVFLLPPGWDASPSQGYPPAVNSPVPIYTPGWREAP